MYVARDGNNDLWLFTEKPERNSFQRYWFSDYGETMKLDAHYTQFKELTWNDEPIEVELKLVNNETRR